MRRKFPREQPGGDVDGWELDITGGTKAERDAAMQWAKKFAEGWLHRPAKK